MHDQVTAAPDDPPGWLKTSYYASPRLCLHILSYSRFFTKYEVAPDSHSVIWTVTEGIMSVVNLNGSFYGIPISSKSEAQNGRTDRRTGWNT